MSTTMQHTDRQDRLESAADGSIALSGTFVAPASTDKKKSRCDIKFVKWLVRKNRACNVMLSEESFAAWCGRLDTTGYSRHTWNARFLFTTLREVTFLAVYY
jgi:hypothetical protein